MTRPRKVTLGEMRSSGVRYCSDYKCSHRIAVSADQWGDNVWLSVLEDQRGADVRPDFNWDKKTSAFWKRPIGIERDDQRHDRQDARVSRFYCNNGWSNMDCCEWALSSIRTLSRNRYPDSCCWIRQPFFRMA